MGMPNKIIFSKFQGKYEQKKKKFKVVVKKKIIKDNLKKNKLN